MDVSNEAILGIIAVAAAGVRSIEALVGKLVYKRDENHFNTDDRQKINALYEHKLKTEDVFVKIATVLERLDYFLRDHDRRLNSRDD